MNTLKPLNQERYERFRGIVAGHADRFNEDRYAFPLFMIRLSHAERVLAAMLAREIQNVSPPLSEITDEIIEAAVVHGHERGLAASGEREPNVVEMCELFTRAAVGALT